PNAAAPNVMVTSMSRRVAAAQTRCSVSVNVGDAPRMCIGGQYNPIMLEIINAADATRSERSCSARRHTPIPNAPMSTDQTMPNATHNGLVGAPMADSSLTTWAAGSYPGHCSGTITFIAT